MAYRVVSLAVHILPLLVLGACSGFPSQIVAADYLEAEQLFFAGEYEASADVAQGEVERGVWNEKWPTLLIRCQLTMGRDEAAAETYETALGRFRNSIGLRMLGQEVYRRLGRLEAAREQDEEIVNLVRRSPWRYSSSSDRIILGRFFLRNGEDARQVLELFYDRARASTPKLADVHVATAELALEKFDYAEASKSLATALELAPDNPDIHLLQAKAWQSSDGEKATAAVARALELNPRHVPSLLFQVDNLIDAERYDDAAALLERVLQVNPRQPEAWAYHAVMAHLQGHLLGEEALRDVALSSWSTNPLVDHLIGTKLSQKYRFAEAAAYQRRALEMDPTFLAAKFQLAQDLMRLGDEAEGWRLANEVHEQDGYNVVAYNLVTLQDELGKFTTLENDKIQLRMDAREARIYGRQALALLTEAHEVLCAKYEATLDGPVIVEIFPQQKDFAIRTFGLPGGAGFLGVCFGRVITANSPASQGPRPANWQSVLWHEFCHVATLEKTSNKIPRWLSEGISVYEEQERDPSWGERLSPVYRQMILGDDLTPVSELSGAFLSPRSPIHLQFAYYESSLVVRYLIEKHGLSTLLRVLTDLSAGIPVNESLNRYVGSLPQLDHDFAEYARQRVRDVAAEVDWEAHPEIATMDSGALKAWLKEHPHHYEGLLRLARLAVEAGELDEAEETLLLLRGLHPEDREADGTLALLAAVYRRKSDPQREQEVLAALARLNDRTVETYQRLCELEQADENWPAVRVNALRLLAVNPLLPVSHELLATSAERLGHDDEVAASLEAMLEMDPIDPAELQFRIAAARHRAGDEAAAKRYVLMALEQAPRYRDAQRLLLELVQE